MTFKQIKIVHIFVTLSLCAVPFLPLIYKYMYFCISISINNSIHKNLYHSAMNNINDNKNKFSP